METTTNATHTPGPWISQSAPTISGHSRLIRSESTGDVLAFVGTFGDGVAIQNAEYIVRAVNSHADLLAACRAARKAILLAERFIPPDGSDERDAKDACTDAIAALRAAIRKAEGQ
jgi:hypothetical protein